MQTEPLPSSVIVPSASTVAKSPGIEYRRPSIVGIGAAWFRYRARVPSEDGFGWRLLGNGYYVDDVYAEVFARGGKLGAAWMAFRFDAKGIDGAVEGVGALTRRVGGWLRPLQTGFVRSYGLAIVAGAVGLLAWLSCRGPARQALRIEPMKVLRTE